MDRKIYNENMVRASTLLVGPFACAYLMAENYRAFGHIRKARKTLLIGVLVTTLIFGILIALPDPVSERIPKFLLPVLFAFVAHLMVRKFQAPEIAHYLTEGGQKHSALKVAGVSVFVLFLELVGTAVLFFGLLQFFIS